jgi:hypothetical protein
MNDSSKNTKQKQPRGKAVDSRICDSFNTNSKEVIKTSLAGGPLAEGLPVYNQLSCEDVIAGKNNTWIVLGRDRPGGSISGNINSTQAGAIDIVVGRMGSAVRQCTQNGKKVFTDPIFKADAARIYISQRTTIDKNFNLAAGTLGSPGLEGDGKTVQEPSAESGIAIKADQLRLIARRSIKIVTMGTQETLSHTDNPPRSVQGINIIAGNYTKGKHFNVQPLVKGKNLKDAISTIADILEELIGIGHWILTTQDEVNSSLADHQHFWGDGKQLTTKSEPLSGVAKNTVSSHAVTSFPDYETTMESIAKLRSDYLLESGDKYINSRWNFLN